MELDRLRRRERRAAHHQPVAMLTLEVSHALDRTFVLAVRPIETHTEPLSRREGALAAVQELTVPTAHTEPRADTQGSEESAKCADCRSRRRSSRGRLDHRCMCVERVLQRRGAHKWRADRVGATPRRAPHRLLSPHGQLAELV